MTNTPVNPTVEVLIDGTWVDVTPDVRLDDADSGGGISISRGTPNEGNAAEPTTVDLTLNNGVSKAAATAGQVAVYSPKNPNGPWYTKLGRNQPMRIDLDRREDAFNRTMLNGWGRLPDWTDPELKTRRGEAWEMAGSITQYQVAPGAATITGSGGANYNLITYAKQYADVEVLGKISMSDRTSEVGVILRAASIQPAGQADGSFENGVADWQISGGTFATTTTPVRFDTYSGMMTVTGSPASMTLRPVAAKRAPVVAGRQYRLRGWFQPSTTVTLFMTWEWYDAAGTLLSTSTNAGQVMNAGSWYPVEHTGVAPIGASYAAYGPTLSGSPANGTRIYCDFISYIGLNESAWYAAYLAPQTSPTPDRLRIAKVATGFSVAFGADWPYGNFVVGTDYWIKAQATGARFQVKIWPVGDVEPDWQLVNYDNRTDEPLGIASGQPGFFVGNGGTCVMTCKSISVRQWRAHVEVTQLPSRWDLSRLDRWVPVQAKGILRRLGAGRKEIASAVTLHLRRYTPSYMWFPLESSAGGVASNAIPGGVPGFLRDVSFGPPELEGDLALPGVSGIATFDKEKSQVSGQAISHTAGTVWSFLFFARIPARPATEVLWGQISSSGTARMWSIYIQTNFSLRVEARSSDGTLLSSDILSPYVSYAEGAWLAFNLKLTKSGGTVNWRINYHSPGDTVFYFGSGSYSGTTGVFRSFRFASNAALEAAGGFQLTQVFHYAGDLPFVSNTFARAAKAYLGEESATRWLRLTQDANTPASLMGASGGTEPMAAQLPAKLLDLLIECAQAEGGFVIEERGEFAIALHTKLALMNTPTLDLDINAGHISPPMDPIEDDQQTRNYVTVSRPAGGFAVSAQLTGPLNINNPEDDPDGVGYYGDEVELPLGADSQLQVAADWRRAQGTLDEARYPSITADLTSSAYQADPALSARALAVDSGRTLVISNSEVSPDPAPQLVQSYTEEIDMYTYKLVWVAQPGRLWRVGVTGAAGNQASRYRDEARVQPAGIQVHTAFVAGTDRYMLVKKAATANGLWYPTADDSKVADFDIDAYGSRLRLRCVGRDLATNGDFETGTIVGIWESTGAGYTAYIDGNSPKNGRFSARCLASGAGTGGLVQTQASNATVVAATDYAIFGWIKTEAAASAARLAVDWYQSNGTTSTGSSTPATIATAAGVWTWFSAVVTAPALTARARLKATNVFAGATNMWIDDVRLVPVSSYNSEPQTITVDQVPVNGVVKTIPVGSRLTLAKPGRVARNI